MNHCPKLTDEEARDLAILQEQTALQGTVRCACKKPFVITNTWRCFFCDVFFCEDCAEEHFGMTKEEWKEKKSAEEAMQELTEQAQKNGCYESYHPLAKPIPDKKNDAEPT